MALYAIGDLHLSLTADKPMEVFGPAWENYTERIGDALSRLTAGDVLVLAGDTSWGIDLNEAEADFRFLDQFPCKKYLVKGNHDYWWSTVSKMKNFFTEKGLTTLDFLHNNCALYGDYALCGTRGWFFEEDQKPHNAKVLNREVGRLETSLKAAEGRSIFCFLHYPPLYQGLPRGAVLLRPPPRLRHQTAAGGRVEWDGLLPDLRRLSGICSKKNL